MRKVNGLHSESENGFTTAWMVGLAFLLLFIGLTFFEFSSALSSRQQLVAIADRAANAGATAIDEDELVASDGSRIVLNKAEAETRCLQAINNPRPKANLVTPTGCFVNGANPVQIEVSVTGEVEYGVIATWLGAGRVKKEFTITSSARPSCSDGSC